MDIELAKSRLERSGYTDISITAFNDASKYAIDFYMPPDGPYYRDRVVGSSITLKDESVYDMQVRPPSIKKIYDKKSVKVLLRRTIDESSYSEYFKYSVSPARGVWDPHIILYRSKRDDLKTLDRAVQGAINLKSNFERIVQNEDLNDISHSYW